VARPWILNKPVVIMWSAFENHGRQVFQDGEIVLLQ
jgi:hypothetical protein